MENESKNSFFTTSNQLLVSANCLLDAMHAFKNMQIRVGLRFCYMHLMVGQNIIISLTTFL